MSARERRGADGRGGSRRAPLHAAAVAARDALRAEAVALGAGDAAALARLSVEKRSRVLELERCLHRGDATLPDEVAAVLRECRALNAANAADVAARLGQTRAALDRLARLAGMGESAGYGPDGTLGRRVPGRALGSG